MTKPMVRIAPLAPQHLKSVAQLHIRYLRTQYRGYAGRQLLTCYYDAMLNSGAACGYVAVELNKVAGFVCGVWDSDALRSTLLKKNFVHLVLWGSLQVLTHPSVCVQLLRRLSGLSQALGRSPESEYELRPIVVEKQFQGTGVAGQLVNRIIQDAALRGYKRLYLITESDNFSANAFYRKMEFTHTGNYQIGTTTYLRYEKHTSI